MPEFIILLNFCDPCSCDVSLLVREPQVVITNVKVNNLKSASVEMAMNITAIPRPVFHLELTPIVSRVAAAGGTRSRYDSFAIPLTLREPYQRAALGPGFLGIAR